MKLKIISMFILFTFLLSCSKGPDKAKVVGHIQGKLNKFKNELFKIDSLQRRGSYGYNDNGKHLLIYYKAELVLLKDYTFASWNSLGANSLTSLLGATESGIKGIKAGGNSKGDILTVYGGSNYKDENSLWVNTHSISNKGSRLDQKKPGEFVSDIEAQDDLDQNNSPFYLQYLARLKHLSADIQKDPKNLEYFQNGLEKLLVNSEIKADIGKDIYGIGTAQRGGEYSRFGETIESTLKGDKKYKSYTTFGSMHNIDLVSKGELKFGIAQGDLLASTKIKENNLRALFSLFPEAIQVLVLAESSLGSVSDLRNLAVNIGPLGSGSRQNAIQVLNAHGIEEFSVKAKSYSVLESLDKLKNKDISAIIFTGAYPFKPVQEFSKSTKVRLLKLEQQAINKLLDKKIRLKIAKNTYAGVNETYATVGTTAVLFTAKTTKDAKVTNLLNDFFKGQKNLIEKYARAGNFSKKNYNSGVKIPFHKAAKKFFK
jgi:TRAP transporter TAXI family solute receptor